MASITAIMDQLTGSLKALDINTPAHETLNAFVRCSKQLHMAASRMQKVAIDQTFHTGKTILGESILIFENIENSIETITRNIDEATKADQALEIAKTFDQTPNLEAEEIPKVLYYLHQLKEDWERITPLHEARYKIDHTTVKAIEGKCPKYSRVDAEIIFLQLEQGLIFTAFSQDERQGVWDAIFSIDHIIPSLYTLLEDLHILQTSIALASASLVGFLILSYTFWSHIRQQQQSLIFQEAEGDAFEAASPTSARYRLESAESLSDVAVRLSLPQPTFAQYPRRDDPDELHLWHD
ncbi:hypothetical protein BX600DRAFT_523851 [Xylariales sp. PMI_506]|nr:hypothetical protein BX600DRAFT_523851 [Xylariales sp. PMI_506]